MVDYQAPSGYIVKINIYSNCLVCNCESTSKGQDSLPIHPTHKLTFAPFFTTRDLPTTSKRNTIIGSIPHNHPLNWIAVVLLPFKLVRTKRTCFILNYTILYICFIFCRNFLSNSLSLYLPREVIYYSNSIILRF